MYVADRIYQHAQATPDAPAMVYNLTPLGFGAFHRQITAMRRALAARRLRPGGIAAIWIDAIQIGWVIDLALRTAGHTTVMIRSVAELASFDALDVVAVVTLAGEHKPVPAVRPGVIAVVVEPLDWAFDAAAPLAPPPGTPAGGHILLTSGTTGRYKMVMIDEAFAAADLDGVLDIQGQTPLLQGADVGRSLVHQFSFGLWTAAGYNTAIRRWGFGGGIVVQQGGDILASYQVPGLTLAIMIPALLEYILSCPAGALPRNDALTIVVAAGALSLAMAEQAKARLTSRIATALGSTESGVWAITPIETPEDLRWHRIHPARAVEVVDEDHRALPPGQLGQVRVRLDNGLAGYLNDAEATAAAFRDGCFYPGDLGVMDARGRLALYGRASDVLNVMGDKIPAAPFEDALRAALGVSGVCVFSEQGASFAEELHVVIEADAPIDPDILTAAGQTYLRGFPDARFHVLAALPRNHMGKVERFKLKQLLVEQRRGAAA